MKERRSFLPLIPQLHYATMLLEEAAEALLVGNTVNAAELIRRADMPEICEYFGRIVGPIDPEVHWQSSMPKDILPKEQRVKKRMPGRKEELEICERDGWRCRFCGVRVISKKARDKLRKEFPVEARWGNRNNDCHCALHALTVSLDHVLPHSRGGTNELDNVVCACGACNFGRAEWTIEEVGFVNPFSQPPVRDNWDGLVRLL